MTEVIETRSTPSTKTRPSAKDTTGSPAALPASAGRDPDLVSVLIPCRNGGLLLARQLESLARQEYPGPLEVVVADNGSTDNTRQVVEGFADRISHLRVVDVAEFAGKPQAVNAAMRAVRGERLIMIDADDELAPGFVEAMARGLDEHTFVGARLDTAHLNPEWLRSRRGDIQSDGLTVLQNHLPFVAGAALGVRASAFDQVGGYNSAFINNQDVDLSWRLQYAGYEPGFVPDAVVHYRYRGDLRSIFRQERGYGRYSTLLYREHREHGLPRRRVRSTVRGWVELAMALFGAFTQPGRARLATRAGSVLGRLEGSWRYRVLYL